MAPSANTRDQLLDRGLPAAKLRTLPGWVEIMPCTPECGTSD